MSGDDGISGIIVMSIREHKQKGASMQQQSMKPALPLWLLIVIVGTIVGVSMGRAQSMGLYLPPVTRALDVVENPSDLPWRSPSS
jgi:hypothetical protein